MLPTLPLTAQHSIFNWRRYSSPVRTHRCQKCGHGYPPGPNENWTTNEPGVLPTGLMTLCKKCGHHGFSHYLGRKLPWYHVARWWHNDTYEWSDQQWTP